MKDNKIFKKWWFWVIVAVIILGAIGSLGQSNNSDQSSPTSMAETTKDNNDSNTGSTLPQVSTDEYKGKEGLVAYKELRAKGYKVNAEFENQALTDINGKASDVFEPLDPNKNEDKQSVDAFIVGGLTQESDSIALTIVLKTN